MQLASSAVRGCGKVTVVGLGGGPFPFRYGAIPNATTIGVTFGGSLVNLAKVVALAESGRVLPKIQYLAFDQVGEAYRALQEGKVVGRAVILPA